MTGPSGNLRGVLLVTLSMAFLATGDATIKSMSADYSPAVFMAVPGTVFVLVFSGIAVLRGNGLLDRRALSGFPALRSLAEIVAALTVLAALARVPLTILTMVLQAMPLMVTLGAVLVLGERVGIRRWAAILVGFAGVAIVLDPGGEGFSPQWLLALAGAVALSIRDLLTRLVPRDISALALTIWAGLAVTVAGYAILIASGAGMPRIAAGDLPGFALVILCWGGGALSITAGMRHGDVSVVAPFRYMRLPFGLFLGVLLFGEPVTPSMLAGTGIIVASGLFILLREPKARG